MKIKSIKKIPYTGKVYNLSVEEDESYVANNIIVHNCTVVPITQVEVAREAKAGRGIKLGGRLPANFPDPGFIKFEDEEKGKTYVFEVGENVFKLNGEEAKEVLDKLPEKNKKDE